MKSARPTLALPLWGLWGLGTANWPKRAEAITELEAVVDDLHDIMELLEKEEGVEK